MSLEGRPWLMAVLLGTVATPAAVILAVPAPVPLDWLLAWPLVLMDRRMSPDAGPWLRLLAMLAGIALTWLHYIVVARLLVHWIAPRESDVR